jgi:hypothetical protein
VTPDQAKATLSRPPVGPDGYAAYVAARFRATPADVASLRARFRGRPVAIVAGRDHVDIIMLMAVRQSAETAIAMAWTLRAAIELPPVSCAPDLIDATPWSAPRLTTRDAVRVALAVCGGLDFMAAFGWTVDGPRIGMVANSAGTVTYVGSAAA